MPVGETQQPAFGAAYASIKPQLRGLCATHDLDTSWVDQSSDFEQLFKRVRDEFERLLKAAPLSTGDRERLQGLIRFTADAASLHERAAFEAMAERLESLERENRELRSAVSADATCDADPGRDERLGETFRTLATLTHKINNPLTSLIGRTQLMRMMAESPERTTKAMAVIEESSRRVADYVRELALVVKESRERELG